MPFQSLTPVPHLQATPPPSHGLGHRVRQGISVWVQHSLPASISRRIFSLCRLWYVLKTSVRSFLGHIETLRNTKQWGVDLGPVLECHDSGHLVENRRTIARNRGMQKLIALYPWASNVDVDIFLRGFDMGEEFGLHKSDMSENILFPIEPSRTSIHATNADKGQTSPVVPAAIDGKSHANVE